LNNDNDASLRNYVGLNLLTMEIWNHPVIATLWMGFSMLRAKRRAERAEAEAMVPANDNE
jgi:hypothetical protein